LLDGETPVEWEMVARDGADLPAQQRTASAAELQFAAGPIYDFEDTPTNVGRADAALR
jgi:hypothetical protein